MHRRNALYRSALLAGLLTTLIGTLAQPASAQGTTVTVSPAESDIACEEEQRVDIRINDVTGLFGVDVKIAFDPGVLEVVDADANSDGVSVTPGDLPAVANGQGLVQTNAADNDSGIVSYSAVRLNPAPAQDGDGVIFSINFRGLGSGTSDIVVESLILSDRSARPIAADSTDGSITVSCDGTPRPTRPSTVVAPPSATPRPGMTPRPTATRQGTDPGYGKPDGCKHVVKLGESLYSIARLHGLTVAALAAANGIKNPDYIRAGQSLHIPGCDGSGGYPGNPGTPGGHYPPGGAGSPDCWTYIVKPGETLSGIAWNTGDSVAGISSRNGIVNPDRIRAGQGLTVCGGGYGKPTDPGYPGTGSGYPTKPGGKCRYTHIVKPGETLSGIAWQYGMASYSLTAANGLANANLIYPGQVLCIP